jgi:hypothetical protein
MGAKARSELIARRLGENRGFRGLWNKCRQCREPDSHDLGFLNSLSQVMPSYRIFEFAPTARIHKPPVMFECEDDQAAIAKAKQLLNGRLIEVWEQQRKVAELAPARRQPQP